ncbi:MAG: FAD-dependent oxidoreductase, partial [Casimicrobiaceae bacterium]
MSRLPVAVIGGGWAGCAAAVALARAGRTVTIFEAAPTLGGRARRVARDGLPLDNGQHLLLGAYTRALELLAIVHDRTSLAPVLTRRPLTLLPLAPTQPDALTLVRRHAPGALGLAIALLDAQGLTWSERYANLAWFLTLKRERFVRPAEETVAQLLEPLPTRVAQRLWAPLCLAALNTPIAEASAQIFANVLRAAFAGRGDASDF